jgi:hypothetical protein
MSVVVVARGRIGSEEEEEEEEARVVISMASVVSGKGTATTLGLGFEDRSSCFEEEEATRYFSAEGGRTTASVEKEEEDEEEAAKRARCAAAKNRLKIKARMRAARTKRTAETVKRTMVAQNTSR